MRFTGAATKSIDIASAALGLGKNTFTNITSRLLTLADSATVQSVVIGEQTRYRMEILRVTINNQPAAIHALRSYLRICMPFTIEAKINSTATIYQQAGAAALDAQPPLISAQTVGSLAVRDFNKPLPPQPPKPTYADTRVGKVEEEMRPRYIESIQSALCVVPDGKLGAAPVGSRAGSGSETRKAIQNYLAALDSKSPTAVTGIVEADELRKLGRAIRVVGNCSTKGYQNAYEVGWFGILSGPQQTAAISKIQTRLNTLLTQSGVTDAANKPLKVEVNGQLSEETRKAVAALRVKINRNPDLGGQFDYDLHFNSFSR
jgi:hypothetical protein